MSGNLEFKVTMYIIVGIAAIVIISVLLDGVKKVIRGLDTAALGALLVFVGIKAKQIAVISVVSRLLYVIGGTLIVMGLLVFIIKQMFRRSRNAKRRSAEAERAIEEAAERQGEQS